MPAGTISIRRAGIEDSEHIARLALLAGEGIPGYFWSRNKNGNETVVQAGARKVAVTDSNFSYQNCHVALYENHVAGLLLGYRLAGVPTAGEIEAAPAFIRPLLTLEQKVPDTFYINMLATYPEYRGRGVGRALMIHAEGVAKALSSHALSLQVFNENRLALEFYLRLGYTKVAELPVVPHESHPYTDKVYLLKKIL